MPAGVPADKAVAVSVTWVEGTAAACGYTIASAHINPIVIIIVLVVVLVVLVIISVAIIVITALRHESVSDNAERRRVRCRAWEVQPSLCAGDHAEVPKAQARLALDEERGVVVGIALLACAALGASQVPGGGQL